MNDAEFLNEVEQRLADGGVPMRLSSGRLVDLYNLPPEALEPEYVARMLMRQMRFNGHTFRPYSVLEHSIMVACLASSEVFFEALWHDATEAFCGDVISPIKRKLTGFAPIEDAIWAQMSKEHGFRVDHSDPRIKRADVLALKFEQLYFHKRPIDCEYNPGDLEPVLAYLKQPADEDHLVRLFVRLHHTSQRETMQ